MEQFEIDLIGCMSCGGSMKCPYCRGKGEKPGIFFKRKRTCKKCNGTGACPFCLGDRKSWLVERMKKWVTVDLRERYNQSKQKEFELRKEYDRLQGKGIQIKTFEEFYNDKKYRYQMNKQVRSKHRIPEILANGIVLYEQVVNDYEFYLKRAEEEHQTGLREISARS